VLDTPSRDDEASRTARQFHAVLNDEEQYSLWPADEAPPPGWRPDGFVGAEVDVLDHIEQVWTDMRPLSLRQRLGDP
jgi:MbtH protein